MSSDGSLKTLRSEYGFERGRRGGGGGFDDEGLGRKEMMSRGCFLILNVICRCDFFFCDGFFAAMLDFCEVFLG